jgi:enamine deaminase RidA (YjgF/YER057c/UK114 family)
LFEHDLFGKPVPTFPDHTLESVSNGFALVSVEFAAGFQYLVAEVDQANVPKLRPIRDRYLNVENPPASTFVVVSRLTRPGWLIEIEAVAALED